MAGGYQQSRAYHDLDDSFMARGRCKVEGVPTTAFYLDVGNAAYTAAEKMARLEVKEFCHGCPVEMECRDYAIGGRIFFGVWGGLDPDERTVFARSRRRARAV